ncbi:hypothetical protein ACQB6R_02395 [Propionibacteriaceae bacterium G1746]|uniref:hypothetical protein n=1 Tax=Aestuariimicrobium sp. G57 TaxID=3418485 RepID=UPI003C232548
MTITPSVPLTGLHDHEPQDAAAVPHDAEAPHDAAPHDPTARFRRIASAVALPLGFVAQAMTNVTYAWVTLDGSSDATTAEALALSRAHGGTMIWASTFALIGCLLIVAGIPTALRVLRWASPRLSLLAGVLMIAGYVCYFGVVFTSFDQIALARHNVPESAFDGSPAMTAGLWVFLVFVAGNLVGTLLLGLAVIVGRRRLAGLVPYWAGLLIIGWPVGHVTNLVLNNEWFAVAGGLLEVAGLAFVARAAIRMTREQSMTRPEWVLRG